MNHNPTDTEMMDWLESHPCISIETHYNAMVHERTKNEIKTGGYNGNINFFSIPSQHLNNVKSVRQAIKMAMKMNKA